MRSSGEMLARALGYVSRGTTSLTLTFLVTLLVLVIPVNLLMFAVIRLMATTGEDAQKNALLYTARSIASAVDAQLAQYITIGELLSHSEALRRADLVEFEREARTAAKRDDAWIVVASVDGQQLINTELQPGQPLPRRSPQGFADQIRARQAGRPLVSDLTMGAVTKQWVATVEVPVTTGDGTQIALVVGIKLASFSNLVSATLPPDWVVGIVDSQGRFVVGYPSAPRQTGNLASDEWRARLKNEGINEFHALEGDLIISANAHPKTAKWTVGVGVKKALVQANVNRSLWWAYTTAGGLLLGSVLISVFFSYRLSSTVATARTSLLAKLAGHPAPAPPLPAELHELWNAVSAAAEERGRISSELAKALEEMRETQGKLARSTQILEAIGKYVPDLVYAKDRQRRLVFVSQSVAKLLDQPAEALLGQDETKYIHDPAQARVIAEHDDQVMETGATLTFEEPTTGADGEVRIYASTKAAWIDDAGKVVGLLGISTDITEEKLTQEALAAATEELRKVLDVTPSGIYRVTSDLVYRTINRGYADLVGRPAAELIGKAVQDVIGPDLFGKIAPYRERVLKGEAVEFEVEGMLNGRRVVLQKSYVPDKDAMGQVRGWIAAVRDVTERRASQRLLQQTRVNLHLALRGARAGVWERNFETGEGVWSEELFEIFGVKASPKALAIATLEMMALSEDRARAAAAFDGARQAPGPFSTEFRIRRANGDIVWLAVTGMSEADANGHPVRAYGIVQDVTDRKHAEERLRLVMREVSHRAKNMLAVIQAIARNSSRLTPTDFMERFSDRIHALGASMDLLVNNEWRGAEIEDLVRSQLAHFEDLVGTRIRLSGPRLRVTASAAQTLGMALHELGTNAGKYGALSNRSGQVSISWGLEHGPTFWITWQETGGPTVEAPTRKGFGSVVIDSMIRATFSTSTDIEFAPGGMKWHFECARDLILDNHRDGSEARAAGDG